MPTVCNVFDVAYATNGKISRLITLVKFAIGKSGPQANLESEAK
jgi:hypothetical protein